MIMMSDPLPDTPFCRVLPSGHEVHWWDKNASKGGRCLCRTALTVGARVAPAPEWTTEDSDPDFKAVSPGLPTEFGPDDRLIVSTMPGRAVYTEQQRDGGEIEASYLHVYPPNAAVDVVRTEVLPGGILVDLSASGVLVEVLKKVIFRG